jgi:hypothetical protein
MSHKLRDLQALTDDELIDLHDEVAKHTSVGVNYYLDEIRRREMAAAMRSSHRVAAAAVMLSAVGTIAAVVALFAR